MTKGTAVENKLDARGVYVWMCAVQKAKTGASGRQQRTVCAHLCVLINIHRAERCVCVCIYICVCICMCVCIYIYVCVCVPTVLFGVEPLTWNRDTPSVS